MIISHRHKFIFMKSYKTAGTSVEVGLQPFCDSGDILGPLEKFRKQSDETPYRDRGKSRRRLPRHAAPIQILKYLGPEKWAEYFRFTIVRNPWDTFVSSWWWRRYHHNLKKSFEGYVLSCKRSLNAHMYRMPDGSLSADEYLRFEQLDEDWPRLLDRLGLERVELPRTKTKLRKSKAHYSTYYTDELRDHVADLCAWEIKEFSYEFDDQRS